MRLRNSQKEMANIMTEPHFYIKNGKLRCSVEWETITGGRFAAERMFSAVSSEFGPRVALKAVNQCFRFPYLLALPPLELGTKARMDRLHQIVSGVADVIPSKGVFPLRDADGVPLEPVCLDDEFVPAPPYPGMIPSGLADRAYSAVEGMSLTSAYQPKRAKLRLVVG